MTNHKRHPHWLTCLAGASLAIAATGCSDGGSSSSGNSAPATVTVNYDVEITRTTHGIPHIKAQDWGSMGYGFGYAYASDNLCVLAKEVVFANGESARFFGEDQGDLGQDFLFQFYNGDDDFIRREWVEEQPQNVQEIFFGYIDGYNRYLAETGVDNLPEGEEGCRGEEWVRPITVLDIAKYLRKLTLRGASDNGTVRQFLLDAQPPVNTQVAKTTTGKTAKPVVTREALQQALAASPVLQESLIDVAATGSNAYGFGSEYTQNGKGMSFGNPHFPWQGGERWYQSHMTMGEEYNVMGVSLHGIPLINVGFNSNIAWSHTVSAANRFTMYALTLNPDNPLQYIYEGEMRDITPTTVSAQVRLPDGTLETREHTFYSSHYGLMADLGSVNGLIAGWPIFDGTAFTIRDANLNNNRGAVQWLEMGQANNISELEEALKRIGIPWVNTIAADRDGTAFYGDISTVPHLTQQQINDCITGIVGPLIKSESNGQLLVLNGSVSSCEWGSDPDSPEDNLYGYNNLPRLATTSYVSNSNDSYWLSNVDNRLEGFPEIMGPLGGENEQQFPRTRLGHDMVAQRMTATDGFGNAPGFTLENLQQTFHNDRVFGAEIVLDDLLIICSEDNNQVSLIAEETSVDVSEACQVLANWDRKVLSTSVGAQIFTEFWRYLLDFYEEDYVIQDMNFWAVPFDSADPIGTPRGINRANADTRATVMQGLATAVNNLANNNVPLDRPWGEVQFDTRNGVDYPISGGMDEMGAFSVITSGLNDGGYNSIRHGNSHIHTVTWDDTECPIAQGILTYSLSSNPESPYYADQTALYSQQEWIDFPYCDSEISAAQIGEALRLQGSVERPVDG